MVNGGDMELTIIIIAVGFFAISPRLVRFCDSLWGEK